MNTCKDYFTCNSPICPEIDNQENDWFFFEDICHLRKYANSPYIKPQKKIVEKCRYLNSSFTYEMLCHNCIIGNGIKGIDPDGDYNKQLKKWGKQHPTKQLHNTSRINLNRLKLQSVGVEQVIV